MNWAVLRREWGAVSFVLTVLIGIIVVPLALYFTNQGPTAITTPNLPTTSSARASSVQTASPARSPSPSTSASASPSPSASASPSH